MLPLRPRFRQLRHAAFDDCRHAAATLYFMIFCRRFDAATDAEITADYAMPRYDADAAS